MGVIVALSLALIPLVGLTSNVPIGSGSAPVLVYYSGSEYRFLAYSYNGYGQPVQGTSLNLTLAENGIEKSTVATTNSSGYADWSLIAPPPKGQMSYTLRVDGQVVSQGIGYPFPANGNIGVAGGTPLSLVTDPANSSGSEVLFFYEGPNGTLPHDYGVYYSFSNYAQGGSMGPTNMSEMTLLGRCTGFATTFKLPPMPSSDNTVTVAVFSDNGTLVNAASETSFGPTSAPPSPRALFTSLSSSILALVVPLMAVLVAYNSYGKDKATGVLESVLTRPVTWRGLSLSRYLAMVFSIGLAVAMAVVVMAGISQVLLGATIPLDFALYTVGGLLVEAAAFVGVMMVIAQLVRSAGGIIGVGIVLWVVLDFFWGIIVLVAAVFLGTQIGSGDYLAVTIKSSFFNPAQFYSLVGEYLNGVSLVSGGTSISPATYGLTPLTLAAAAAFWVLAPLAGVMYLVARRD